MAEDPREKPLEELQKDITCAVCDGLYHEAKLLPCNHYYCSTCIEKMAARSGEGPFDCPECRKEMNLPPGGVAGLQPAFFVEKMKEVYGKMARAEGKVEAVCGQCEGEKSVAFCRQCADFICEECVAIHDKLRAFADHVVSSFEDLKRGGIKNVPVKEPPPRKCGEHDKTLKLFCLDCERLICRDCVLIHHKEHKYEFLTKYVTESRLTLRESLAPLQKVQAEIASAEKDLLSEETKVDQQEEAVCGAIQQSFEQLRDVLERRKTELVGKVCSFAQEKKMALAEQKMVLQTAQKEIQLVMELVERNVENTTDQDMVNVCKQLQKKVDEEVKRHQSVPLKLTATADISWSVPSPDDIIPKQLGVVYDESSPPTLFNITSCEFEIPLHVSLSAPTASLKEVSASLGNVACPSQSLLAEVNQVCPGMFSISVTPKGRGRHDLTVKVKGKQIEGSPFRLFVTMPPSQVIRKKMHRVIGYATGPFGVAIGNQKQVLVGEIYGDCVSVHDQSGKRIKTIDCNYFRDPCSVAVASNGDVYVADSFSRYQLLKFNSRGELCGYVREELQTPSAVKIIDSCLFALDSKAQMVKVYDMDYNLLGTIETKECPTPRDLAQGPDGLLYVSGKGKISVYQCAIQGAFVRHLNLTPSSLELGYFNAICFDPCGRIVVSAGDSGVFVITPTGQCIGHITKDAIVNDATGVAVDDDGFIYVCSFAHHGKVFVF